MTGLIIGQAPLDLLEEVENMIAFYHAGDALQMLQQEQQFLGRLPIAQFFEKALVEVLGQFGVVGDGQGPQPDEIRIDPVEGIGGFQRMHT